MFFGFAGWKVWRAVLLHVHDLVNSLKKLKTPPQTRDLHGFFIPHGTCFMTAKFFDIEQAFDYVSSQSYGMNAAFLSLDTGQIFYISSLGDSDELPDDFEESDRYIEIPHKNDLDLGRRLVDEFINTAAPQLAGDVSDIFRQRGAYGRFKSLLERHGLIENWFKFENDRELNAIKDWCRENNVEIATEIAP